MFITLMGNVNSILFLGLGLSVGCSVCLSLRDPSAPHTPFTRGCTWLFQGNRDSGTQVTLLRAGQALRWVFGQPYTFNVLLIIIVEGSAVWVCRWDASCWAILSATLLHLKFTFMCMGISLYVSFAYVCAPCMHSSHGARRHWHCVRSLPGPGN